MLTNNDIMASISERIGNDVFVYCDRKKKWYSYNELWTKAFCISNELGMKDVESVVAILENGIDLFSLYFACMLANITIIPLDPQKSDKELSDIIKENDQAMVIRDEDDVFKGFQYTGEPDKIKKIQNINLEKTFMITYTSGSTGHAKGVKHSLKSLLLSANSFGKITGLTSDYTMCHVMPMTYMAGILNTIIMPFLFGCRIVLLPRFDVMSAVSFWKKVEDLGVTAFWLSPTMLSILMTVDRKGKIKDYLRNNKTLFYVGTAPLYLNIRKKFEEKYGVSLLQSYGLSETLFISTETVNADYKSDSVGVILPEVEISVSHDDEIGLSVPWMFLGYSNENTSEYFNDQYYISGDLGKVIDGYLYITGRKKDLIIKGGMNISPAQIEDCIAKTGLVKECAVAGIVLKDVETIVCWYVCECDNDITHEINKAVEADLGRHCRVDIFRKTSDIPKNLNGKPDKIRLVEEFGI